MSIFYKASKTNSAPEPLRKLIGSWMTNAKHPLLPGAELQGKATLQWLEGGTYMIMHAAMEHEGFPAGVAVFGCDDTSATGTRCYSYERNTSRIYTSPLKDGNGGERMHLFPKGLPRQFLPLEIPLFPAAKC